MKLSFLTIPLILLIFALNSGAQSVSKSVGQKYENEQRAAHLLLLRNEIKGLEDAAVRCYANLEIAEFIIDRNVRREFDSAGSMVIDCLEDTVKNLSQFSSGNSDRWRNSAIFLLRKNSPALAMQAEKKYLDGVDATLSDLQELTRSGNTVDVANRTISKIAQGKVSDYVLTIYQKLRVSDPNSANRILNALLGYCEMTPNTASYALLLDFIQAYYLEANVPAEISTRYLSFITALSRKQIADPEDAQTGGFILRSLGSALPKIKTITPTLFQEAQSIFFVLNARFEKINRERDEVQARINASNDKLQQTISEAEATLDERLKKWLWSSAAKLALKEKRFRLSVDCILKNSPEENAFDSGRDYFLLSEVLPATLSVTDFDSSDYAIGHIEDVGRRSSGKLQVSAKYLELKNSAQATELIDDAVTLLQKGDASIQRIGVLLKGVGIALKIDKSKAFGIASQAIKMTNRLPTPTIDDKLGTASRTKYVDEIILPNAYNFADVFKTLARSDAGFAAATSQEIESKTWRLVAEIAVEKERKYPVMAVQTPQTVLTPQEESEIAGTVGSSIRVISLEGNKADDLRFARHFETLFTALEQEGKIKN